MYGRLSCPWFSQKFDSHGLCVVHVYHTRFSEQCSGMMGSIILVSKNCEECLFGIQARNVFLSQDEGFCLNFQHITHLFVLQKKRKKIKKKKRKKNIKKKNSYFIL